MDVNKIRNNVAVQLGVGYYVSLDEVVKNNGVKKQCIIIHAEGETVSPVFYLENYMGVSDDEITERIIDAYKKHRGIRYETDTIQNIFADKEKFLQNVVYRLVNKEKNKELLSNCPHKEYLDLAVVYSINVKICDSSRASILIKNEHTAKLEIGLDNLDERAKQNTLDKGFCLKNVFDILRKSERLTGAETSNGFNNPMYVFTNEDNLHGAAVLCFAKYFSPLANVLQDDLYIFPSSVHEIITIPACLVFDTDAAQNMVCDINRLEVEPNEVLSDNVYRYSLETGEITIV